MKYPHCGANFLDGSSVCQTCGKQVGAPHFTASQLPPQPTKNNRVLWIVVIAVILVVVVPLAIYVVFIPYGGTAIDGPTARLQAATITNGEKITIVGITRANCPWDNFKVQLSDSTKIASWNPTGTMQASDAGHNYSTSTALAGLTVCLWIYDQSGNGFVDDGDYFTLFTYAGAPSFSHDTVYSAYLLWEPNGELCGQPVMFTG